MCNVISQGAGLVGAESIAKSSKTVFFRFNGLVFYVWAGVVDREVEDTALYHLI